MRHLFRNIVIALLLLAPLGVAAQTMDLGALQAQIAALQAQIAAQLGAQQTTAPQSTGSGARCVTLTLSLDKGDTNAEVTALQTFLINEGLLNASATGYFGTQTEAALKQWQSMRGVDPVGRVGPSTRAALACTGGTNTGTVVSNQCPNVPRPATCANAVSVQVSGCTVGWQCSVSSLPPQTFTATPVSGPTPLVVKFSGVVTSANAGFCAGNFCAATLVFGDGTTGAVPLPNAAGSALSYEVTHTYTTGGTFIANLYQGSAGSGASVVGNGITITPIAPAVPTAPTMSVSPTFGSAPLTATITVPNVTSGANLSIEFGDGTFGSVQQMGAQFGATHTYNMGGSYTIKLRRTNGAGDTCVSASCPVIASVGLSVASAQVASASLVATPASGLAPLPVTFFTNGGSLTYGGGVVLDFGDNTSEYVCPAGVICGPRQIQHTYQAAGTYNVQLLGLNPGSGTTVLRQITVSALTPQSTSLSATPTSGAAPLTVTFTGHGGNQVFPNGAILKYGDDTTETFCNPNEICGQKTKTHTYVDGSQYSAQLIALESGTASTTIGTAVVTATGGPTKVKITAPTGSARKGESVPLSWTIRGTKPSSGSLSFDLYTQAGVRIGTILSITNFQSGSATWKLPSSADKNCTTTQPNGLCGVVLAPGMYRVQANVSGVSPAPELTSEATFEIRDELIAPGGLTVSITPTSVELGKNTTIKHRVANPPSNSGVALYLVKPTGESMGLIASKQDADTQDSMYTWQAGEINETNVSPGQYHILAKVYSPINVDLNTNISGAAMIHALATSTAFTLKAVGTGGGCVVLNNNLSPGDNDSTTNGEVTKLQTFLAQDASMYPEGIISGTYGNLTRRAVERYQASKGIVSSGSPESNGYGAVGPTTRAAIAADCGSGSSYNFRATPLAGRAPLVVTFTAKALGTASTSELLSIDFGDGSNAGMTFSSTTNADGSRTVTATHSYATNGTYIAKLVRGGWACTQSTGSTCSAPAELIVGTATVRVTNTTTPPASACAAITRTLGVEDTDATTGGDVSRLQQFLAADPTLYPEGEVTGFYGALTERAVKRYQASKGIAQLGNVGPQTLAAIRCAGNTPQGGIFSATPMSGAGPLLVRFTTDRAVTSGSYRVNFGDGTSQWLTASSTSHTYSANGTYTAELVQSIGNCFGTVNEALRLCELGSSEVLATKTITVTTAANMSIAVTPTTVGMGSSMVVNWTTSNAPAGSLVRLEVYRDGATEPALTSSNDQGLTSGSSNLAANGSFTWTLPAAGTPAVLDGGFGGFVMTPGTYHITGKLYTGSQCWGYCASVPERAIHAAGKSGSFTVSASATGGGGGGGCAPNTGSVYCGAVTGSVSCTTYSGFQMTARVTLANGATRDFKFDEMAQRQTLYADFAAVPTSIIGLHPTYWGASINGWRPNAQNTETGRTAGSISLTSNISQRSPLLMIPNDMECSVTWR